MAAQLFVFGSGNVEGHPGDLQAGIIEAPHYLQAMEIVKEIQANLTRYGIGPLSWGFAEPVGSLDEAAIKLFNRGRAREIRALQHTRCSPRDPLYEDNIDLLTQLNIAMGCQEQPVAVSLTFGRTG